MQIRLLLWAITICLNISISASAAPEVAAFKSEEEMVAGWYHRHEKASWLRRGAQAEVIDSTLDKIAASTGTKRDDGLVDTQIEYSPGNWVFEWVAAGDASMAKAKKQKGNAKHDAYNEALTYYTIASWPHLGRDDDKFALTKAREAYLLASRAQNLNVKHVTFDVLDTTSKGYLHLPKGKGPFPLVIFTHGSDVTKEDGLEIFTEEMGPRGIAVLTVDLTGIGEASHIPLSSGSDVVLAGARQYAANLANIDQDNVFVAGASFGGNAAARYFANEHPAAGVISMCGPLHRPFVAPPEVYDQLPILTIDGVKSRLGILGEDNVALAKVTPQLSVKGLLADKKIDTPLFIFTTTDDPVAPIVDLPLLEAAATDFDKLVIQQVGHCPPRWVRQPVVSRWIRQQMK
tara:strand:- start:690 stop:1898 length:1209 start_codon:yes stop_codon:yes gene_type:complete